MRLQPAIMCGSLAICLSVTSSRARPSDVVRLTDLPPFGRYKASTKRHLRGSKHASDDEDERGLTPAALESIEEFGMSSQTAAAFESVAEVGVSSQTTAKLQASNMLSVNNEVFELDLEPDTLATFFKDDSASDNWNKFVKQHLLADPQVTCYTTQYALLKLLMTNCSFEDLRQLIDTGTKVSGFDDVVKTLDKWLRDEHPIYAMQKKIRTYISNKLKKTPNLAIWAVYTLRYSEKFPQYKTSIPTIIMTHYNDEDLARQFESQRWETDKELTNDQVAWLKYAWNPDNVFTFLELHKAAYDIFACNLLDGLTRKANDFYNEYPKLRANIRKLFPCDDKTLIDMVFYIYDKRNPKAGSVKDLVLKELSQEWIAEKRSPDIVYPLYGLDKSEGQLDLGPRMKRWIEYVTDYNYALKPEPPVTPVSELKKIYGHETFMEMYDTAPKTYGSIIHLTQEMNMETQGPSKKPKNRMTYRSK